MTFLPYVQIALAIAMMTLILMQQSDAGLGAVFGGTDSGGINRARRGSEKVIFNATIVVSILFVLSVLANFLISS